jgi:hypothetical protein
MKALHGEMKGASSLPRRQSTGGAQKGFGGAERSGWCPRNEGRDGKGFGGAERSGLCPRNEGRDGAVAGDISLDEGRQLSTSQPIGGGHRVAKNTRRPARLPTAPSGSGSLVHCSRSNALRRVLFRNQAAIPSNSRRGQGRNVS